MTWQDDDIVCQGKDAIAQAGLHLTVVAAGEVGASDGPVEQEVAGEHHLRNGLRAIPLDPIRDSPRRVTGNVIDGEGDSVDLDLRTVDGVADVGRLGEVGHLGESELRTQHGSGLPRDRRHRVAQQVPIGRMNPNRAVVFGGHVLRVPHVVEVAVRDEHCLRSQVLLTEDLAERGHRVHSRVDDSAAGPRSTRHDIAVGGQRASREGREQHGPQSMGARTSRLSGMSSPDVAHPWGRVTEDGTVFVRTTEGERQIGQWPGGDPAEAIALYSKRFEGLEIEVDLLEKRLAGGTLGPDDAERAIKMVREQVDGAAALGDLDSLLGRLDALAPALDKLREERKAARDVKLAEALTAKTRIVETAE